MLPESREFALFVVLLVPGILLANLLFIVLALVPLSAVLLSRLSGRPGEVKIAGGGESVVIWSGQEVAVGRTVAVGGGPGLVIVHEPLPPRSRMVGGSNTAVFWKGEGPIKKDLSYRLQMTRRGRYRLGPAKAMMFAPSLFWPSRQTTGDTVTNVMVRDQAGERSRVADIQTLPRLPRPDNLVGNLGAQTSDFKDIREYVHGDRFRNINWKATARNEATTPVPLVNTYEVEERPTVLILLDNGPAMSVGAAGSNVFEHATQAAMVLAHLYLAARFEVGLMAIDDGAVTPPGKGKRQEALISRALIDIELDHVGGGVEDAVRAFPDRVRTGALVIVVTSVGRENFVQISRGLQVLRRAMGKRGRVILLDVRPREEPAEGIIGDLAAQLVGLGHLGGGTDLGSLGVEVHTWDPAAADFTSYVLREFGVNA